MAIMVANLESATWLLHAFKPSLPLPMAVKCERGMCPVAEKVSQSRLLSVLDVCTSTLYSISPEYLHTCSQL